MMNGFFQGLSHQTHIFLIFQGQFGIINHRGQDIIEFMRHQTGHGPQRSQFLGGLNLLLQVGNAIFVFA
ncbi:MAG: hypothetical protein BWY71_01835 [Planctomycetes bacterium ADurb.Bin412]|nr:MAG: hypothetical protein BWY71_01835 [Planctomycetes bacterium ADurb.Bin412]